MELKIIPLPLSFIKDLRSEFYNARYNMNNNEKLDKIIALLTAMREGKELQWFTNMSQAWHDFKDSPHNRLEDIVKYPERYRVKPKPREWWHVIFDKKEIVGTYDDGEDAKYAFDKGYSQLEKSRREIIHVREVL
jgi:hypothetical protein